MGLLGKVFRKSEKPEDAIEAPPCPHTSLVQRWDNLDDMGDPHLAQYVCDACGESFNYDQAQSYLQQVGTRLER